MPFEWLGEDDAAAYGRYAGPPSQAELEKVFFIDDEDRELIARRRGSHMKLGFALQLVTVRYVGTFLEDPLEVPVPKGSDLIFDHPYADSVFGWSSSRRKMAERRTTRYARSSSRVTARQRAGPCLAHTATHASNEGRPAGRKTLPRTVGQAYTGREGVGVP